MDSSMIKDLIGLNFLKEPLKFQENKLNKKQDNLQSHLDKMINLKMLITFNHKGIYI